MTFDEWWKQVEDRCMPGSHQPARMAWKAALLEAAEHFEQDGRDCPQPVPVYEWPDAAKVVGKELRRMAEEAKGGDAQ